MLSRRSLLVASLSTVCAAPDGFQNFIAGMRAEARQAGISAATLDRAFAGVQVNQKVLEHYRHQPEFTMTWAQYRALLITDQRIANGRAAFQQNRALLGRVKDRFGVDPGVITGIWGLESSFGAGMGDYHVIEALATLAWEGRRASFFRGELMAALRILDHGDVAPAHMLGSYAGAMGQPQFMPSSYLRYAVDFEGHGRRDIWTSKPDVLASIANYLAQSGWRGGEPWGQAVALSANVGPRTGRDDNRRPVGGGRTRCARGRRQELWRVPIRRPRCVCRTGSAATPSWSMRASPRSVATTRRTTMRWWSGCSGMPWSREAGVGSDAGAAAASWHKPPRPIRTTSWGAISGRRCLVLSARELRRPGRPAS